MEAEDRDDARLAKAIIRSGRLNPGNCATPEDGDHALWDHLHIMSDFKLDVDALPQARPGWTGPSPSGCPAEREARARPLRPAGGAADRMRRPGRPDRRRRPSPWTSPT